MDKIIKKRKIQQNKINQQIKIIQYKTIEQVLQLIEINLPFIIQFQKQTFQQLITKSSFQKLFFLQIGQKVIDIHCSQSQNLQGYVQSQQVIPMTFKQFIQYNGQLKLKLAQHQIYNYNQNNQLNDVKILPFLTKFKLVSINLWHYKCYNITNWHYDSYDNFLCLIKGTKTFHILPPKTTKLNCGKILSPNYNQANEKIIQLKNDYSFTKQYNQKYNKQIEIEVNQYQALFIPKGYFHKVISHQPQTIGLNYWFNSIQFITADKQKFYLCQTINELANIQIKFQIQNNLCQVPSLPLSELSNKQLMSYFYFKSAEQVHKQINQLLQNENIIKKIFNCQNQLLIEIITNKFQQYDFNLKSSNLKNVWINREIFYNKLWEILGHNIIEHFLKIKYNLKKKFILKMLQNQL